MSNPAIKRPIRQALRAGWLLYALAATAVAGTLALRIGLASWFGDRTVLILFVLPIFFSAYIGGLGPGLVATATAALGTSYFLIPPLHHFSFERPVDFAQWLILILVGLLISVLTESRQSDGSRPAERPTVAKTLSTERKVQGGFGLALACLCVVGIASYQSVTQLRETAKQAQRTQSVISSLNALLSAATDAETAQRGYVITADEQYLDPYHNSQRTVSETLNTLKALTADSPVQQHQLELLAPLINDRMGLIAKDLELRRSEGFDAARTSIANGQGKRLHDQIRQLIASMETTEQQVLIERNRQSEQSSALTRSIIAGSSALALCIVTLAVFIIGREFASTRQAEELLRMAKETLEVRVRERTEALAQSHESVRVSEARMAGIVGSAMDAIVSIDHQQRILLFNTAAEKMFGYSASEIIGQSLERLIPQRYRDRHRRHVVGFGNAGISSRSLQSLGALNGLRADGEEFPIEASISQIELAGQRLFTVILRDISERKRAEQALRDRERQLSLITNALPGPVSRVDREGRYLFANRAYKRWFGWNPEEMIGKAIREIISEDFYQQVAPYLNRALQGEMVTYEVAINSPEDGLLHAQVTLVPDFDTNGVPCGHFTILADISERKRAEAALQQLNTELEQRVLTRTEELAAANQELEAFSYSVSHDLRAPLRAINGFSRILLEDHAADLDKEAGRYLGLVRKNATHMGHLVDDLLSFARLSRQALSKRLTDPAELVRLCLDELREDCAGRQLEIKQGELPGCLADPALLKQVWINLLSNALKYTRLRRTAEIEIGSNVALADTTGAAEVVYFIKDNGVGFDMRYSDKLFGVFQRMHRAEDYEGTGVGLAIVQRIVHRHGGRIWAESELERGASFYFTLGASLT